MRNICSNCFSDVEIVAFINTQANHVGECDFCDSSHVYVMDAEVLYDFFKELLDNFRHDDNGQMLWEVIRENWNLFSSPEVSEKVLDTIIPELSLKISDANELVVFSDEILENVNYWTELKENIKWERRFTTDLDFIINDLGWDGLLSDKVTIDKNCDFYRARLHHTELSNAFSPHEMLSPDKYIASSGRANPAGIPFLYLCDNKETVLYEIRATYLDEISIGTFSLKENILDEIFVADFTTIPSIFYQGEGVITSKIKSKLLKDLISHDLSKPIRRYDSKLDYVPTQFICEFIRYYTVGAHGIKFKSSLHPEGNNLVIFDQDLWECKGVDKVKIKEVIISA